ncbi:toprim domain-containing protein [Pseudomonas sp. AN-1]|uniref:toprim domain-containing protein n=1 Tax=Pseudomonas sp. AN-1 TaxID=3096605 RepID=UPI002A69F1A5|nr:toprim domain-containing protein [Pseudomonas sp. AN-1]WPP47263.1 toprim domain-containing protein [Pseudomonas sp. AN-1]
MTDPVILFRDELAVTFGPLDWLPIPDGQIHRFHVPGDRAGSRNGWYVLHLDGIACGAFGSWKASGSSIWSSRRAADHLEAQLIAQRIEQAKRQREAEQHQRQQAAAIEATGLWAVADPAGPDHPYLTRKGCQPHGLRQLGDVLLVPLVHDGRLVNLQRIARDGSKRFLFGGRVTGCYSPIGRLEPGQPLYICEGWATGATIHEAKGAAVACAMNAGNLFAVGDRLRRAYPESPLIVAGDDDRMTEGNPGRTAAERAAADLGAVGVVFPPWCGDEPLELSDFNDLRQWREAHQ